MRNIISSALLVFLMVMVTGCYVGDIRGAPNKYILSPTWPTDKKSKTPLEIMDAGFINTQRTVTLINGRTESQLTPVYETRGLLYSMDFRAWTELIIERLDKELTKGGVRIVPSGNYVFKVSLSTVNLIINRRSTATSYVTIEKVGGAWTKTYKGTSTNGFGHGGSVANSIYNALENIIKDPVFREALK